MSAGNVINIGTRVDLGNLQAKMQEAAAAVKQASANMAEAQLQFGKAAESGNLQAAAALKQYEGELARAKAAVAALSESEERETSVLRGGTSARMAASAELRVLEGNFMGSTRAAGAFLSTLPGIGAAMQIAFPVFGVIALVEILARGVEALSKWKDGLSQLAAAEQQTHDQMVKNADDIFRHQTILVRAQYDLAIAQANSPIEKDRVRVEMESALVSLGEKRVAQLQAATQHLVEYSNTQKALAVEEAKRTADLASGAATGLGGGGLAAGAAFASSKAQGQADSIYAKGKNGEPSQMEKDTEAIEEAKAAVTEAMAAKINAQNNLTKQGDKSAAEAAKVEADAQFRIMLENGQRQLEFQQRLTDSLNETWLKQEHVDQEVARKQEEYSKEATRQFIEDQRQKVEAAKEAAEQQSRTAEVRYRGVEQSTAGDVQEGTLTPAQRIAILQKAAAQEYQIKQASIEAQKALDVGNVAAYQQDLNKMEQLDQQYALQKAQLELQETQTLAQPFITAFNSVNNQWLQLQDKLIFGTKNVSRAFANMGVGMLESFAASVEKMVVKALEADLKMLLSKQITAQQQVNTTAVTTGEMTAIKQTEGLKQALIDAKNAAVSGWKAGMALPFPEDLVAAPALAAAGFAGAIAQFDIGGIIPGSGAVPILGHGGERVLTQEQTRSFERLVDNSMSNSGNASTVVHVHGFSDRLFRDQLARNAEHVTRAAQRGLRNKGRS